MKISYQVINCQKIEKNLLEEFIILEKSFFKLMKNDLINSLSQKDLLYAFFDKEEHKLIGTLAIKWIILQDYVIVYVGNGAVETHYQRHHFVNTVLFDSCFRTLWKFPGKKMCFACFMATPKSYNIAQRYPNHFPQKGTKIDDFTKQLMKLVAQTVAGEGKYEEQDDIFLLTAYKKMNLVRKEAVEGISSYDGYFEEVNPYYKDGKQLLMLFRVDLEAFLTAGKYTLKYYMQKIPLKLRFH
ncbi:hypothetical protein IM40_06205 [Candidatus Paracaedimonas acanthamoebae]|nr:hypothetical protein IM40_06205 [Candidatus Paracaedimonas acanthamoebae]